MEYLRKEEFELFNKYAGTTSDKSPDAHELLKELYCKLGDIAAALHPFGYITHIRRNPLNQGKKYESYHWAQVCPSYCLDTEWKIFFVIDFTANGFGTHIDCNYRKGLKINKTTEELQFWEYLSVEEVCKLSKDEIVKWVLNYCERHKIDFLRFGKEYKIKSCIKLLNMESFIKLLANNHNLILTGAPGTGKTYLAQQIAAQMILGKEFDEKTASDEEKKKMEEQYDFVQFHPSFDYTDFIEGLRPIDDGYGNISFRREDGIFMKFCRKALDAYTKAEKKKEAPKYVFVIDEINRGDLSKVFGELFFCIDPGYRGEKGKVKTQYCNLWKTKYGDSEFFYIPENVYVIGTMNDIDRSVESMDFAMRRRFAFKDVRAENRMEMIKENEKLTSDDIYKAIKARMTNLNLAILTIQGLSTAYQIGAAYFLKLENYLTSDGKIDDNSWKNLWDNHLYGLLFEYLRGLPNADEDLKTLQRAYNLDDIYKMDNKKVIKESSQNA